MRILTHLTLWFALAGTSLLITAPAHSASCAGISMPNEIEKDGEKFILNGIGLRLSRFLAFKIKVYAAGLYLTKKSPDPETIISDDQPRHIELHFLRDVNQNKIRNAMQKSFERNAGELIDTLKVRIEAFKDAMTDLKTGQTLTFSYLPGKGTTVTLEGVKKAIIEGADFASALFSLWLANPPNSELKIGLLGGDCQ